MCRLLGYVSDHPVNLRSAVGPALGAFMQLATRHGDGWGLAHVDRESSVAKVARAAESALASGRLQELSEAESADSAILHLRWATPGLGIRLANTHPFVRDPYTFMHNGAIFTGLDALVPDDLRATLEGDTDSERYFMVVLDGVRRLGVFPGIVDAVRRMQQACTYTSLNAMMLTPEALFAVSEHTPERIPADEPRDYYAIRYRKDGGKLVIASSGWPQDGWVELPNHTVTRIDRATLAIQTERISNA